MRPRRSRSIPLAARLATRKEPVRFVSMTVDQSSSLIRSSRVSWVIPALATSTSTGPCASSTCAKAASTDVGVGHVADDAERAFGWLTAAVGDRDLVPRGDERLGDGAADAAVSSGDEYRSAHSR